MLPISAIASSGIPGLGLQPGMNAASGPAQMGEVGAFPMELGKLGDLGKAGGAGNATGIGGITGTQPSDNSFSTMLGQFVQDVNAKQGAAADAVTRLQSGGDVSLHQAVISMEEANVSFQLMVEVRNKLLESYQEIMRMQV